MSWSFFAEVVNVVAQIATTCVAAFGAWLAYQTFLRTPHQEPEFVNSRKAGENVRREVLVFKTTKQKTRLKVTDNGLECYLDDLVHGRSEHQWTLSRDQARKILTVGDYRVDPGYKIRSGLFSVGPRRNWLYSKSLYPEPSLLEFQLEDLLKNVST